MGLKSSENIQISNFRAGVRSSSSVRQHHKRDVAEVCKTTYPERTRRLPANRFSTRLWLEVTDRGNFVADRRRLPMGNWMPVFGEGSTGLGKAVISVVPTLAVVIPTLNERANIPCSRGGSTTPLQTSNGKQSLSTTILPMARLMPFEHCPAPTPGSAASDGLLDEVFQGRRLKVFFPPQPNTSQSWTLICSTMRPDSWRCWPASKKEKRMLWWPAATSKTAMRRLGSPEADSLLADWPFSLHNSFSRNHSAIRLAGFSCFGAMSWMRRHRELALMLP